MLFKKHFCQVEAVVGLHFNISEFLLHFFEVNLFPKHSGFFPKIYPVFRRQIIIFCTLNRELSHFILFCHGNVFKSFSSRKNRFSKTSTWSCFCRVLTWFEVAKVSLISLLLRIKAFYMFSCFSSDRRLIIDSQSTKSMINIVFQLKEFWNRDAGRGLRPLHFFAGVRCAIVKKIHNKTMGS